MSAHRGQRHAEARQHLAYAVVQIRRRRAARRLLRGVERMRILAKLLMLALELL